MAIRTSLNQMQLGDRIICEYRAPVSGSGGAFLNLGSSTASLIPNTASATPSGSFYFIYMGQDTDGRRLLVADRNVQHTYSWNALNQQGWAALEGEKLKYDVVNSCVAAYDFNSTAGTTLCSYTGAGYDGTFTGTSVVTGYNNSGYARSFNGTTNHITFSAPIIPLGSKSIRFKMKHNGNPPAIAGNEYFILGNSWDATKYGMLINVNTAGKILVAMFNGTGVNFVLTSTTSVCDNNWHDILFTWDGTTSSGAVKIYIDNMSTPDASGTATSLETTTALLNFMIGCQPGDTSASETRRYRGIIDQLEIYAGVMNPNTSVFDAWSSPYRYYLRMLSGGSYTNDIQHEFYNTVVTGTGNGLINVGGINDWNWSLASLTSSTRTTNSSRAVNGGGSVSTVTQVGTGSAATTAGFRPVLVVENLSATYATTNIKTSLDSMQVGDMIACQYNARSTNAAGNFANLGQAITKFIPQSGITIPSSTTGNGFYFIKVAKGLLVADRIVQTGISWDSLNADGYIEGAMAINTLKSTTFPTNAVYVNATSGSDSNIGTAAAPVQTINKAITIAPYNGMVVFENGVYNCNTSSKSLHDLVMHKDLTYIGKGQNTVLEFDSCAFNATVPPGVAASFYNLVIRPTTTATTNSSDKRFMWYNTNGSQARYMMNFYNVAFEVVNTVPTSSFFVYTNSGSTVTPQPNVRFVHCTFRGRLPESTTSGTNNRFLNCVSDTSFTTGNPTTSLLTATLDSNFQVTAGTWQNVGTGTDADGSTADLGVYGGLYAWGNNYKSTYNIIRPNLVRSSSGGTSFNRNSGSSTLNQDQGLFPVTNEWDSYIAQSNLNNTIIAGDNTVWNWANGDDYLASWTSDTPHITIGASSTRVMRGVSHARSFNGTSDYITLGARVIPIGKKTIIFNIKTTGTSTGWKNILNTRGNGTGFLCYMNQNTGILVFFYGTANGATNYYIASPANINDNSWHRVKFEYDGTTNVNGVKLYIDNMATPVAYAQASAVETTQSFNLVIGRAAEYSGDFFSGQLDELKILDGNNNIVLYHPMNEASGNLTDQSGNGYTGTVTGTTVVQKANLNALYTQATTITTTGLSGFRPVLQYEE